MGESGAFSLGGRCLILAVNSSRPLLKSVIFNRIFALTGERGRRGWLWLNVFFSLKGFFWGLLWGRVDYLGNLIERWGDVLVKTVMTSYYMVLTSLLILLVGGSAWADTGVSDSRVSLPEGPGSLEGVGENVEMDPNMGSMRYNVAIKVPEGFKATTPGLNLSYNSGGGTSIVGMGWTFTQPTIERSTSRRLPLYDKDDFFTADGGTELVYIPGAQVTSLPCPQGRVYRSRFEETYTRYTWCKWDQEEGDYWVAESSSGTKTYFGADRNGVAVSESRVGRNVGDIFRYHLVDTVDLFGHHMKHRYVKDQDLPSEQKIQLFSNGTNPTKPTTDSLSTTPIFLAGASKSEIFSSRLWQ